MSNTPGVWTLITSEVEVKPYVATEVMKPSPSAARTMMETKLVMAEYAASARGRKVKAVLTSGIFCSIKTATHEIVLFLALTIRNKTVSSANGAVCSIVNF